MTLKPGTRLGSYEVLGHIGSGGMGEMYRAWHSKLGREVALKILPDRLAKDPEALQRFEQEARLASSLNHPNIITIYDIGQFDSSPYIVMELIKGKTLQEVLAEGPMPLPRVAEIAAQIAKGLAKAHAAGIVHRDLKPQNLMVANEDDLVKILDFGLGKLAAAPKKLGPDDPTRGPREMNTLPGVIMGTVGYMSPQQASGISVDFRSDQFSLGTILYEMVTGKRPFRRETAAQTLAAIIEGEPEPVEALNPDVPEALRAIIRRCLEKDPLARYSNTTDLAKELKHLRNHLPEARRRFLPPVVRRAIRRRPARMALLLLAAAMALGVAVYAPSLRREVAFWLQVQSLPAEKQLAVLPFTNIGNDPANQAFCDGLVEILSSKLSQLVQFQRALNVVPASELRTEGITSAREARRVFGATLAITGSVQRTEGRVRMTINLVDTQTLRQLKATSLDTEAHDVSVLQDGVVLKVADLLEVDLPEQAKQVLTAGGTTVPGAYEFYMQGKGYLQRYEDPQNVETAIGLFQRALEQDSRYALADAGLGEAYWRKYELTKDPQWADQAVKSCATAIGLNNKLAPVYVTLGMIYTGTGRYDDSIRRVQQAIGLDPLNPDAYRELARAYENLKKLDEAESTYKRAIAVRPSFWSSHNDLGRFYFRFGRYPEAEKEFRQVLTLTPDNWRASNALGAIYYSLQRYDEAEAMYKKSVAIKPTDTVYNNLGTLYFYLHRYADAASAFEGAVKLNDRDYRRWRNLAAAYQWSNHPEKMRTAHQRAAELAEEQRRINPRDPVLLRNLADSYSMLGESERARGFLREALTLAPDDVTNMFQAAIVYEQLGDREYALQWIAKAIQGGYSRDLIERDPNLAQLRSDPRFQGLRSP